MSRWLIACSPVATVLAGLGYFAYSQMSVPDVASLLPATTAGVASSSGIVTVGVSLPRTPPEPIVTPPVMVDDEPPPAPLPAEPRVVPRKAAPAAEPRAHSESAPVEIGPCTAGVAALGLCTPAIVSAKE